MAKRKTEQQPELVVDFLGGAVGHRFRQGEGRGQALAKAVGLKGDKLPTIVDATAGLGRDAFLLASLGAEVTLIERSEKMHRLLAEGMARAREASGEVADVISRMQLVLGNSIELLPEIRPDVVLVDPMHPPRKKSALVKQEMRLLREIVGTDEDALDLMRTALQCAKKRVVLKWPKSADVMEGIIPPTHQFIGKSTRYDVYMIS